MRLLLITCVALLATGCQNQTQTADAAAPATTEMTADAATPAAATATEPSASGANDFAANEPTVAAPTCAADDCKQTTGEGDASGKSAHDPGDQRRQYDQETGPRAEALGNQQSSLQVMLSKSQ